MLLVFIDKTLQCAVFGLGCHLENDGLIFNLKNYMNNFFEVASLKPRQSDL